MKKDTYRDHSESQQYTLSTKWTNPYERASERKTRLQCNLEVLRQVKSKQLSISLIQETESTDTYLSLYKLKRPLA